MSTIRPRIARLAAASALALGLGVMGAGPALASYNSWAGSVPPDSTVTYAADDGASPDGGGNPFPVNPSHEAPDGQINAI